MRATMRITWLLLSLSFLFHSVCSNDDGQNATSVTKDDSVTSAPTAVTIGGGTSGTKPATHSKPNVPAVVTTGATGDAGKETQPTQAPTPTKPTAVATTPAVAVTATSKPTPTQPQASTVINNSPAPPTTFPGAPTTAVNNANPAAVSPAAATADSSGILVVTPKAAVIQTPEAPVPSKISATEAPGNPGAVGTTKITKVSTDAPTPGQQSMTHTTSKSKTSQDDSKGVVTDPSPGQTTSRAPEPAGNTGPTSTPSTLTKAGPSAADTLGTKAETTSPQAATTTTSTTTTTTTTATTTTAAAAQPKTFLYSLNNGHENEEEKELVELCRRLMANLQDGNCSLTLRHHNGKIQFDCVEINGKVKTNLVNQYYEEITKKPTDNKTLIAILASCGALLIMIVILAVCASHHRKPYNENQQHLTEELHTVENGYHDNPTLEVMEVQPEMQEKKMALNGEFNNDSWIVPIDNLLKEDIPDEEDTHL